MRSRPFKPAGLIPPPEGPAATTLVGTLERVTFTNDENAWSVVKIALPNRRDLVTAVGNLLGVQPGENLRLSGHWITDKKYGEQFKVVSYVTVHPATLVGLQKYLGSGLVRGVGSVMAERLVEKFGMTTLEIIDATPERLEEVEGIGPVRAARIREAWVEQRGIKDVMIFLQAQGISTSFGVKIYKQYGDRAIAVVKENPYRLATEIFGIGFKSADRIAATLGIPRTSPQRARAGVLHLLGEASDEGHVFMPRGRLLEAATQMLEVEPGLIEASIGAMASESLIVVETPALGKGDPSQLRSDGEGGSVATGGGQSMQRSSSASEFDAKESVEPHGDARSAHRPPVVKDDAHDAVYLPSLHTAEAGTASMLRRLIAAPARPLNIDADRALAWFEERQNIQLAAQQREAIRSAFRSKVLVITGGPGTGKTTLVNGIIQILEKKGRRIQLAAPTGRAAKRLEETTGRAAGTLHRALEFSPKNGGFLRDPKNPLAADVLVVDEASMLDIVLAYHLLRAVPVSCQLILVGDVDQIPSVGPGCVLADLIRSEVVDVVRLTEIFRQAESSRIVVGAHRVNRGEMPHLDTPGQESDFFFFERATPEAVLSTIKLLVGERIPKRFGFDPLEDIQVLTPMHRGLLGAQSLNAELQTLLNPGRPSVTRGTRTFSVGDRVMQIRNNYDLEVFNGDIGRVDAIDEVNQELRVRYDERTVAYDTQDLDELVLAYACSIHKAQGSEYPCVVVPLHTQHYVMLQRNLLYTAITRGKRLVILVGTKRALAIAVRNAHVSARFTRLAERLRSPASPRSRE